MYNFCISAYTKVYMCIILSCVHIKYVLDVFTHPQAQRISKFNCDDNTYTESGTIGADYTYAERNLISFHKFSADGPILNLS